MPEVGRGSVRAAYSSWPLVIGLVVQAGTSYAVLIVAGRALGAARFGGLSALYVLLSSVATGLFLPLEQEVARRRGQERVRRSVDRDLVRQATELGLLLSVTVIGIMIAAHGFMLRLLAGDHNLLAALAVALPGYACCFISRGVFAGAGELGRYGVQLGVEGAFRLVGALAIFASGWQSLAAYGWLFGLAPWVALAASLAGRAQRGPAASDAEANTASPGAGAGAGAGAGWGGGGGGGGAAGASAGRRPSTLVALAAAIGLLLISSLASQLLVNAGPVIVSLLARPAERTQAGTFLAALVLVRVPVFLFTAVQPSFLPTMAAHAAADRRAAFVQLVRRVLLGCALLTVVSALLVTALGPVLLRALFGFTDRLSPATFFIMAVSVGLFLIAAVLAQALLGRAQHAATSCGWIAGLAGLGIGTAIGDDPVHRASAGFLIGALTATAVLGALLARNLRDWERTTP